MPVQAKGNWITNLHEDGRYRKCVLAERHGGQSRDGEECVGAQIDQLLGNGRDARGLAGAITVVDPEILAVGPAQLPEPRRELHSPGAKVGIALRLGLEPHRRPLVRLRELAVPDNPRTGFGPECGGFFQFVFAFRVGQIAAPRSRSRTPLTMVCQFE